MPRKRPASEVASSADTPCGGSPAPLVIPRCDEEGRRLVDRSVDNHIMEALGGEERARHLARHNAYLALAVVTQRGDAAPFFFLSAKELTDRLRTCSDDAAVEVHAFDADGFAPKIRAALGPHGISAPHHWIEELNQQAGDWLVDYIRIRDSHESTASARRALQLYLFEDAGARELPPGAIRWASSAK